MAKEMLFGFVYMPQALRVEDFSPYWVLDRWTKERMLADLKIMRAIGSSCIRIHITPPVPGAISYDRLNDRRTIPITGEKYLEMYDLMVRTVHDLGMHIHFDIGSSFSEVSEASLDGWMKRYKGLVESYQFANENYGVFESDMQEGTTSNLERFQRLLNYARRLDPDARFTADIYAEQIAFIRDRFPDLYHGLDVLNTHPYYCADDRGFQDEWVDALVAVHTPHSPWPANLPWQPDKVFMQHLVGVADFGKELWITEIAAQGDGAWSSLVPEDLKASGWRKVVQGLAQCEQLSRIYYCWLTDKMHTMEAGVTQIGAVNYDGSPTPLTHAFQEMAEAHAPADSLIRRLQIHVDTFTVQPGARTVTLGLSVHNRSTAAISGHARLELPPGLSGDCSPFEFSLQPGQEVSRQATLQAGTLPEPHNHVFLHVEAGGQVHYGWGMVSDPRPLSLSGEEPGLPGVRYVPDLAAVQEFLTRYGNECAIVVGPGTRHWDTELGYRLKIVIGLLRDRIVPIKTAFRLADVWDRPLIIVGRPTLNYCAQLVELGLPVERRASALGAGESFAQVVERPLGEEVGNWDTSQREMLLGFHKCPAALYVAGQDDEGTKRATYDLIRRLWHPRDGTFGPKAHWL
jgi:hypothetical protein